MIATLALTTLATAALAQSTPTPPSAAPQPPTAPSAPIWAPYSPPEWEPQGVYPPPGSSSPYAPPRYRKPNRCRASEACRKDGRCTSEGDGCVVGSGWDCQVSEICKLKGRCSFDPEKRRCDDGTERKNPGLFIGGMLLIGLGGAAVTVGAGLLFAGSPSGADLGMSSSAERLTLTGGVMMAAGASVAWLIGLPMTLAGTERERVRPNPIPARAPVRAELTGTTLRVHF